MLLNPSRARVKPLNRELPYLTSKVNFSTLDRDLVLGLQSPAGRWACGVSIETKKKFFFSGFVRKTRSILSIGTTKRCYWEGPLTLCRGWCGSKHWNPFHTWHLLRSSWSCPQQLLPVAPGTAFVLVGLFWFVCFVLNWKAVPLNIKEPTSNNF